MRGFRIELGEIEAALPAHPAGARGGGAGACRTLRGGSRLVAYRRVGGGAPRGRRAARRSCKARPAGLHGAGGLRAAWRALPLTPNGKVDRRALPAPSRCGRESAADGRAPRTPAEELLAGIWRRGAGARARWAVDDNFFELGGHSLLATQVVSRVREALRGRAAAAPAVRGADGGRPRRQRRGGAGQRRRGRGRRSSAAPRTGPLPLSFAQERLWFLDQLDAGQRGLQHRRRPLALDRGARRARRCGGARRGRAAARGAAHDLPEPWTASRSRRSRPAGPLPLPVIDLEGLPEPARGRAGADGGEARAAVRPRRGPAAARRTLLRLGRGAARPAADDAPHRLRRLVDGGPGARAGGALRGVRARAGRRRCRSCRCSTPTSPSGSGAGWPASALERQLDYWRAPAGGRAGRPRAADRPAAAGGADARRRAPLRRRCRRGSTAELQAFCRREGATLVHGAARRLRRPARALRGPGGRAGGLADRRPQPGGDRGADRLLRQHPGPAGGSRRRRRPSATCCGGCGRARWRPTPTRTCRSRPWSRSCGRSATSRGRRCSRCCSSVQTPAPGAAGPRGASSLALLEGEARRRSSTSRSWSPTRERGAAADRRVQHRPVRGGDDRAAAGASRRSARRRR